MQQFIRIIDKEAEIEKEKANLVIQDYDETGDSAKFGHVRHMQPNKVNKEEKTTSFVRDHYKRSKDPLLFSTTTTDTNLCVQHSGIQWQSTTKHTSSEG